jgi:hypothetical protein
MFPIKLHDDVFGSELKYVIWQFQVLGMPEKPCVFVEFRGSFKQSKR